MIANWDYEGIPALLASYGANLEINYEDAEGRVPFHACMYMPRVMVLLIEHFGADPDFRDSKGRTALAKHLELGGVREHDDAPERWLLAQMNHPREAIDVNGRTLMHYLCAHYRHQSMPLVGELIARGVNYKEEDKSGVTPADLAARRGWYNVTKLFVRLGAVPAARHPLSLPNARIALIVAAGRKLQKQILLEFWACNQILQVDPSLGDYLADPFKAVKRELYFASRIDPVVFGVEKHFQDQNIPADMIMRDYMRLMAAASCNQPGASPDRTIESQPEVRSSSLQGSQRR